MTYSNKQIWKISFPIFLSLLAQNIINVTDTAFLGRVGEVELGASAMGGLFYISAFTIAFGFSTGSQIIIGRRNGERNYKAVGPVVIQGVFFLLFLASLLFVFSRYGGNRIMRMLISSDTIRHATLEYLDWRVFGFFFSFVNVMFRAFFVGVTRSKILMVNALIMALVNVLLDYLLIFGYGGFPKMGLEGAAIASVIAEVTSVLFFFFYTYFFVDREKYGLTRFTHFDFKLLRRVLSISLFTMMQYFISMSTFFLFFVVMEHLGQRELAIANIVRSVYIVLFIPVNSLSATTNTLVSNTMGAGKIGEVIPLIKHVSLISLGIAFLFSLLISIFPQMILSIYTNDALLVQDAVSSIYVIAVASLICAVAQIIFSGVSGTGNTRSAFVLEMTALVGYCAYIYIVGIKLHQSVAVCFTSEIVFFLGILIVSLLYFRFASWQKKKI